MKNKREAIRKRAKRQGLLLKSEGEDTYRLYDEHTGKPLQGGPMMLDEVEDEIRLRSK